MKHLAELALFAGVFFVVLAVALMSLTAPYLLAALVLRGLGVL